MNIKKGKGNLLERICNRKLILNQLSRVCDLENLISLKKRRIKEIERELKEMNK